MTYLAKPPKSTRSSPRVFSLFTVVLIDCHVAVRLSCCLLTVMLMLNCNVTVMLFDCHVDWLSCWLAVMLLFDCHVVIWLSCCHVTAILIDFLVNWLSWWLSCWLTAMLTGMLFDCHVVYVTVMLLFDCHVLVTDCCLTVEGAKQVEKHREFYTQVLDYVYCSNTSRKGRASLDQLFNTVEELKEQTKVHTHLCGCIQVGSG